MKVISKLRSMVIVLLGFAAFNVVLVYIQIDKMRNDGRVVNFAGVVRGATQRLIKEEIAGYEDDELIIKLDNIIQGLTKGNAELELPEATDVEFISKMRLVEEEWINVKKIIQQARQDPKVRSQLFKVSEAYWQLTNSAVAAAEEFSKEKVNTLKTLQIILFILNLIILGSIWVLGSNSANKLKQTINAIATSSTQIAAATEEQERVAAQQAVFVEQTSTTMQQLDASSYQSADQAEAAANTAQQVLTLSQGGTKTVEEALVEMAQLKEKVDAIAQKIVLFREQSDRIGNISSLVNNLASQTNMLAFNASVEAARSGSQGKEFSIIANEIRHLANESKKSAAKIDNLVAEIQENIDSTVIVTDEGTKTVEKGVKITQKTVEVFASVESAINSVVSNNHQISITAQQQAVAIKEIVQAINILNQGAKETAIGVAQTKLGTQQLNEAAQNLNSIV